MSELKIPAQDVWDRHVSNRAGDGWPRHKRAPGTCGLAAITSGPPAEVTE